jgi:hypothetical protein
MASLKERLAKKREDLKRSGPGKFITAREGTTRVRILPVGEEKEFALESTYFYLGLKDNMGVISPKTIGKKCKISEVYEEMSSSKDASDRDFAKKFRPSRRFLMAVVRYTDDKGKEIDKETGVKLMLVGSGVYQELIDLYLDDDAGDFTDPIKGYDIKIKRTGKGKMDTEYTVLRANPTKLPKEYRAIVDLDKMVTEIIPTYKETIAIIEEYLNLPPEEEEEEENPKKKKSTDTAKKKRRRDL